MIQDGSLQVLNHKFTQQLKCCAYHIHDWGTGDSWSWKFKEASSTSWRIRKTWQVNPVKMCPKQLIENASEILELVSSLEGDKAPIATKSTRQYILDAAYTRLSSWVLTTLSSLDTVKTWGTVQYLPMDLLDRSFAHACHCFVVQVKVNLAFLFPERWTLLKLLS